MIAAPVWQEVSGTGTFCDIPLIKLPPLPRSVCPIHGENPYVMMIEGEEYCLNCCFEAILADAQPMNVATGFVEQP